MRGAPTCSRRSSPRRGASSRCGETQSRCAAAGRARALAAGAPRRGFRAALAQARSASTSSPSASGGRRRAACCARDYDPVAIATRLRGGRRRGDLGADRADVLRRRARAPRARCARPSTCRCCARTSSSSEYQLLEARAAGADAVLLIVAALDDRRAASAAARRARRSASTCSSKCTTQTELRSRTRRRRDASSASTTGTCGRSRSTSTPPATLARADAARTSSRSARAGCRRRTISSALHGARLSRVPDRRAVHDAPDPAAALEGDRGA